MKNAMAWQTSDGRVQIVADLGNPTIKSDLVLQKLRCVTLNFKSFNIIYLFYCNYVY